MLGYPLSSNLLALFSGSFYGTAGPDKKGKRSERGPVRPRNKGNEKETRALEERVSWNSKTEEEEEERAEVEYQNGDGPGRSGPGTR